MLPWARLVGSFPHKDKEMTGKHNRQGEHAVLLNFLSSTTENAPRALSPFRLLFFFFSDLLTPFWCAYFIGFSKYAFIRETLWNNGIITGTQSFV